MASRFVTAFDNLTQLLLGISGILSANKGGKVDSIHLERASVGQTLTSKGFGSREKPGFVFLDGEDNRNGKNNARSRLFGQLRKITRNRGSAKVFPFKRFNVAVEQQ